MPPIYLALSLMPMRRVVRSGQYQGADWGGFGWADAGVIISYQLYMMYGDVSVIHENWELMTRYMDYLSTTDKLGGLLPDEASVAAVTEQLTSNIGRHNGRMQTGFLGTAIILPALTKIGRSDLVYMLLFQDENPSWLYSVMQGATTTWERWDSYTIEDGFGDAGMNSFNHYAYGAVAGWMFSSMAGIGYDPSAPGFANILFAPRPNEKMKSVEASYESAYGTVTAKSCFEGDRWNYTVTVPANATATVKLPVPSLEGITVNGKKAASLSAADGVAAALLRDGYAVFEVTAGTFSFSVDASALYRG